MKKFHFSVQSAFLSFFVCVNSCPRIFIWHSFLSIHGELDYIKYYTVHYAPHFICSHSRVHRKPRILTYYVYTVCAFCMPQRHTANSRIHYSNLSAAQNANRTKYTHTRTFPNSAPVVVRCHSEHIFCGALVARAHSQSSSAIKRTTRK